MSAGRSFVARSRSATCDGGRRSRRGYRVPHKEPRPIAKDGERLRRGGSGTAIAGQEWLRTEAILKSNPEQLCYYDLTTAWPVRMRSIACQFHSIPFPGI